MPEEGKEDTGSMVIRSLKYAYPGGNEILSDFSLELPPGSRCLLSGANGAGKTTLLQIFAGKTMVSEDAVRVIGKPPFHDISLTCSGDLGYLGAQWRRNIGSAVRRRTRLHFFVFSSSSSTTAPEKKNTSGHKALAPSFFSLLEAKDSKRIRIRRRPTRARAQHSYSHSPHALLGVLHPHRQFPPSPPLS